MSRGHAVLSSSMGGSCWVGFQTFTDLADKATMGLDGFGQLIIPITAAHGSACSPQFSCPACPMGVIPGGRRSLCHM